MIVNDLYSGRCSGNQKTFSTLRNSKLEKPNTKLGDRRENAVFNANSRNKKRRQIMTTEED